MKASYRTQDGRMTFEVSGDTPKQIWEQVAAVQELFEADSECGLCHSKEGKGLRFVAREYDDNKYYELRCLQCFARLSFGQHKKGGGLFAKRKDKDGNRLEHRGWEKYERKQAGAAGNGGKQPSASGQHYEPDPAYSGGITDDDVPF